ncbi:kinase-like domain-containing protein [Podospora fimiseda]|uniref:EKC/KEOPS complex subunit BUD32 n=1 Tax=Podospora fimiseda TaxID=252190 RepID=A0AAN7GTH5_9PEZI|nr:kinase-like domain-containing protein [Podospora fimiseda]
MELVPVTAAEADAHLPLIPDTYRQLTTNYPTSDYQFWKSLDSENRSPISLYKRKTDGETYVALPATLHVENQPHCDLWKLYMSNAGEPAANVLNHENLLSLQAESVLQEWQTDDYEQIDADPMRALLFDYCDAGNLETLLNRPPVIMTLRGPFMPESLCWHVTLSLLRALQWLHQGIRDNYDVIEDKSTRRPYTTRTRCHRIRSKSEAQLGWFPILHRDITPGNVLLNHPKGIETYGTVKLGGMAHCLVTGGMPPGVGMDAEDAPVIGYDRINDPKDESIPAPPIWNLREWYGNWKKLGKAQPADKRPYTTGCDIWAVGAILYRMMFGLPPPAPEECKGASCNSWHWYNSKDAPPNTPYVQSNTNCVGDHDLQTFCDHLDYSKELKLVAKTLMCMYRRTTLTSEIMDGAWRAYSSWVTSTEEGKLYRDVYDDIWFRRNNEWRIKRKQQAWAGGNDVDGDVDMQDN